jgi:hypothetical protein
VAVTIFLLVKREYDWSADYHNWESEVLYECGYFSDKAEAERVLAERNESHIEQGYARYVAEIEVQNKAQHDKWQLWMDQDKAIRDAGLPGLQRPHWVDDTPPPPVKVKSKETWIEKERITHYELEEVDPYESP